MVSTKTFNNIHRLISLKSESKYYGNGFFILKEWRNNIHRCWKISDRIAVLQLSVEEGVYEKEVKDSKVIIRKIEKFTSTLKGTKLKVKFKKIIPKDLITIINVYAPHTQRLLENINELDELYTDLGNVLNEFKNKSQIYIAGDFNAKVGANGNEDCIGRYSRGTRNMSGQNFIEFCTINDLFITNTAFKHPARHITTWCGNRKYSRTNEIEKIYNQIDYIVCTRKIKCCLVNARSYAGTVTSSDHRLVVTRFNIEKYKLWKPPTNNNSTTINSASLSTGQEKRKTYQQNLNQKLENLSEENISWNDIKDAVIEASNEVLNEGNRRKKPWLYEQDIELEEMSKLQKALRVQIENSIDSGIV